MRKKLLRTSNLDIDYSNVDNEEKIIVSVFENNHFQDEYFLEIKDIEEFINNYNLVAQHQ